MTPCLSFDQFSIADAAFILELVNSPGWIRHIGDRNIRTNPQAVTYLKSLIEHYPNEPLALQKISLRQNNQPVGMCGILHRRELPYPDIGYALLPAFKGNGYAIEMVRWFIEMYHLAYLNQPLLALVDPANTRSIHLLNKVGFSQSTISYSPNMNTAVFCLKAI